MQYENDGKMYHEKIPRNNQGKRQYTDLRNIKKGDLIIVGIQNKPDFRYFKTVKEVRSDYFVDEDGNFFYVNGLIKRAHRFEFISSSASNASSARE